MERAQAVLDHSSDLASSSPPHEIGDTALHLLRAADHDHTTLNHALRIGRTRLRREPANHSTKGAVQLLETVIAFLGHKRDHQTTLPLGPIRPQDG